jgi:hypothetical protein
MSLIGNANLISKVYFPGLIVPVEAKGEGFAAAGASRLRDSRSAPTRTCPSGYSFAILFADLI